MGKKLFVGNLPFSATEQVLRDSFAQVGTVESVKIITDRNTGRSKGFGFIEMSTDDEAGTAIEKLNGADYEGRKISVSEAKPQEEGSGGGGRRPGGGGRGPRGGGGRGGFGGGNRGGGGGEGAGND